MLQAQKVANKNAITLKGSVEIVTEFLEVGLNSILYQRGLYPAEEFTSQKKYGLNVLMTNDASLREYLSSIFKQLKAWLGSGVVSKIALIIQTIETKEVVERWTFDIQATADDKENQQVLNKDKIHFTRLVVRHDMVSEKSEAEVQKEIQAVVRQITASVTFLPVLEDKCTFNLLIYTDKDADVPQEWIDSDPGYIKNPEQVRLRSFSTGIHKVDTLVCYKYDLESDLV